MAKCKDCGESLPAPDDPCPKCGLSPGPETLTDMPGADVKGTRSRLKEDIAFTREREELISVAECRECGESLPTEADSCPRCGLAPGPETLTDYPRVDFKKARKQLKEEIKEAKEKGKPKE